MSKACLTLFTVSLTVPWPMLAGSVALGWMLGRMFPWHSTKSYKVSNGVMNRSLQIYERPNVTSEAANQPPGGLLLSSKSSNRK